MDSDNSLLEATPARQNDYEGKRREPQTQLVDRNRDQEEEEEEEEEDYGEKITEIEKDIKQTQQRLKQIQNELKKYDFNTQEYQSLYDERRVLRKNIVDLDYFHKTAYRQYHKQQAKKVAKEVEQRDKKIKEEYEEKIRIIDAQKEKSKKEATPEKRQVVGEQQVKSEREIEQKKQAEKSQEVEEVEVRHKLRVAEIEAQLASQRLRRSRQIELEAELISIRRSNLTYSWWNLYPYTERFFLRYQEIYPHFPSYLHYLYRYPSLDYINPYRLGYLSRYDYLNSLYASRYLLEPWYWRL